MLYNITDSVTIHIIKYGIDRIIFFHTMLYLNYEVS